MIDFYTWITPNGLKISIALEEFGLPYKAHAIDITKGEQFAPDYIKINPASKIPAIVDHDTGITLTESGAILIYLAEKTGRFLPQDLRGRVQTMEWLFWQVGGLGPMAGQNHHFGRFAPEKIPYAIDRYVKETNRLYGVMNTQLGKHEYLAGDYSIADMAAYPWVVPYEMQGQKLENFPNLKRWFEAIKARPAVVRAYEKGDAMRKAG